MVLILVFVLSPLVVGCFHFVLFCILLINWQFFLQFLPVIGFLIGVRHFSLLLLGSVPYSGFDNLIFKKVKFTLEQAMKA